MNKFKNKVNELEITLNYQETFMKNIQKELKKARKELEQLKKNKNTFERTPKTWVPNLDEVFWVADIELNPVVYNNIEQFKNRNERIFKYNRIFKTLEECEFYCGIQRAFRNASREFDINKANYFLFYSYDSDAINYSCQNRTKRNNLYFDSEKTMQNLIDKFGEENVKRYYLGVY